MHYSIAKKKKINQGEESEIVNFLSNKSGYSETLLRYKISNNRVLKRAKLIEVKEVVDSIIKEGYTYENIICSIKVLDLKNDFIKKRFSNLQMKNHRAPFLDVLLLSDKAFVKYVNNLSIQK